MIDATSGDQRRPEATSATASDLYVYISIWALDFCFKRPQATRGDLRRLAVDWLILLAPLYRSKKACSNMCACDELCMGVPLDRCRRGLCLGVLFRVMSRGTVNGFCLVRGGVLEGFFTFHPLVLFPFHYLFIEKLQKKRNYAYTNRGYEQISNGVTGCVRLHKTAYKYE